MDKKFAVGSWVLLSSKNIKQKRPSRKLSDKWLGPFRVCEVVGDHGLAYRLEIPNHYRVHDVFPISLLEPYVRREGEELGQSPIGEIEGEPLYEVEEIVSHRGPKRRRQYLIRWRGYSSEEDTWEPRHHIEDDTLMEEYEEKKSREIAKLRGQAPTTRVSAEAALGLR
ncbi:hypothetical protein CSAL01_02212 [Colletotrichum salicis]|uniref:Chromo domain-containing protein n=1 Tax=Colletotrichum salicis TaxID=1209931 RepID=A0A135V7H5_9PEZI|nr:hypothetical protein CSAL01_02212 [Colletotrichum salicis]